MEQDINISTDRNRLDLNYIYDFLSTSYWANTRSKDIVQRSIEHSLCFGVYLQNQQIGFARVATDYAVFAYIMDVFIDPSQRGKGYSKQLMKAILAHPEMKQVSVWRLGTLDAHGLYRQFGFTEVAKPEKQMELLL
jgi:GNAT superfamily N-acetyltransferase